MIFDEEQLRLLEKASFNKRPKDTPPLSPSKFSDSVLRRRCGVENCLPLNHNNLFDEMLKSQFEVDNNGLHQIAVKRNLWAIFFEAIKISPKFQKLKAMIDKSEGEKSNVE